MTAHRLNGGLVRRGLQMVAQARADRMRHGNMGNASSAKKGLFAGKGTVDELIDNDKNARSQMLTQKPFDPLGARSGLRERGASTGVAVTGYRFDVVAVVTDQLVRLPMDDQ